MSYSKEDELFNELSEAVFNLRNVFLKHGLTPPSKIELAKKRDEMILQAMLPRELTYEMTRAADLSNEIVFSFMGVDFCRPKDLSLSRHAFYFQD